MSNLPAPVGEVPAIPDPRDARWRFLRDVAVFHLKLFLNNLHNFLQVPLTLAVAGIDLVLKGETEGERFYRLLEYGRTIDDSIDIYSVIAHREKRLNQDYTVDALVCRLQEVIIREYQKGGTAASVRSAVDRAIDDLQNQADKGKGKVSEAFRHAAEKLRRKMDEKGRR